MSTTTTTTTRTATVLRAEVDALNTLIDSLNRCHTAAEALLATYDSNDVERYDTMLANCARLANMVDRTVAQVNEVENEWVEACDAEQAPTPSAASIEAAAQATGTYPHVSEADGGGIGNCPCADCTRLDWDALDDERPTLRAFRTAFRASL